MKRKIVIRGIIVFFCLAAIFLVLKNKDTKFKRPHIIIIAFDALRADHLSCYGYPKKTTPNIDNFSKEAVLFENAVAPAPATAQSFMSLFTALRPGVHKIFNYDGLVYRQLAKAIPTLPEVLKNKGYFTAGFSDTVNLSRKMGFNRGFDVYEKRSNFELLDERLTQIQGVIKKSKQENKPLFLFIHTFINHAPYVNIPVKFSASFLAERVKGLPVYSADVLPNKDAKKNTLFFDRFNFSDPHYLKHLIGLYDSAVFYNDYIFGELKKLLEAEGLYDNSILIVLADHGEEFFDHGGNDHGHLFVECLHVPLLIKFPLKLYSGMIITQHARTMDILPTLLDFLSIPLQFSIQGESFLPLLRKSGVYNPLIISQGQRGISMRFIKDGYVYSNKHEPIGTEFLFDFKKDPAEKCNLVDLKPDLVEKMRTIAYQISEEDKKLAEKIVSEPEIFVDGNGKILEELKALGYAQ